MSAEEVIWDIKDFYRSGEVRDPSSEVHYQKKGTDTIGNPDNELRLSDLPPVDKGKTPAKAAKKESARERDLRERNERQAGMVRLKGEHPSSPEWRKTTKRQASVDRPHHTERHSPQGWTKSRTRPVLRDSQDAQADESLSRHA